MKWFLPRSFLPLNTSTYPQFRLFFVTMIDALNSFEQGPSRSFFGFTPLKTAVLDKDNEVTDDVPAPYISKCGHAIAILSYCLLVSSYLTYSVVKYVYRPEVETFSQQPSSKFPPPVIRLSIQCFDNPNCGETILVTQNYSTSPNCNVLPRDSSSNEVNRTLAEPMDLTLCYVDEGDSVSTSTGELITTPGLSIDFEGIVPGSWNTTGAHAAVVVEVGSMRKVVGIDAWQVKSFYVGMSVTKDGSDLEQSYYSQNLQYDGKRPTWRATYVIRLAQLASVYEVTRPGHWLDVIAQVGGAATIIAAILVLSEPFWAKFFPGKETRLLKGRMAGKREVHCKDHKKEAEDVERKLFNSSSVNSASEPPSEAPKSVGQTELLASSRHQEELRPLPTGRVTANPLPPINPVSGASRDGGGGGVPPAGPAFSSIPDSTFAVPTPFNVNDSVQAMFENTWHPATVVTVKEGGILDLRWYDGTFTKDMPVSMVKRA